MSVIMIRFAWVHWVSTYAMVMTTDMAPNSFPFSFPSEKCNERLVELGPKPPPNDVPMEPMTKSVDAVVDEMIA